MLLAVRSTVTDFGAMTQRVEAMISLARKAGARYDSDEVREAVDFLAWLLRGNFVLLGAREYEIRDDAYRCIPGSGLGILADEERSRVLARRSRSRSCPRRCATSRTSGELLIVDKANARSPVHRHERMDYVGVRRVTPDGEIAGEARLLGLFTTKAYAEPASETPVLHRKLRRVLEAEDLIEGSHDYKGAVALFDTFPKDELFAAPVDDLRRAVVALLALEGTDRVRLLGRRAADGRSASFILALPRDRYRTLLVDRVRKLFMRRFKTRDVEAQHVLGEGTARVRVHFRVHAPDGLPDVENARARARGRPARAHLGRRAARRAGRALRRARGRGCCGRSGARACPTTTRATRRRTPARPTSRCSSSSPRTGRSWSRCSRCRSTRASRSTSAGRRSSSATRCRCSRTSGCA